MVKNDVSFIISFVILMAKIWIFGFSLGVCPMEPSNLVFSLGYLVSNGRQVLLGGIRLDGSTTGGELNHGINPCVILCLCCFTCVLVVVEVISRV